MAFTPTYAPRKSACAAHVRYLKFAGRTNPPPRVQETPAVGPGLPGKERLHNFDGLRLNSVISSHVQLQAKHVAAGKCQGHGGRGLCC